MKSEKFSCSQHAVIGMIEFWSSVIYKISIFGVICLVITYRMLFLIKDNTSHQLCKHLLKASFESQK